MNRVPGIIKGIIVLLIVVGIGAAIGWLSGGSKPSRSGSNSSTPSTVAPVQQQDAAPAAQKAPSQPEPVRQSLPPAQIATQPLTPPSTPSSTVTNWEDKLDEILASDSEENAKARQMAAILPSLPQEGQVEVAQHLSNLVSDEDYGLISGFLTNSTLADEVLDVFIADSLNRPNGVKLPLLLDVAKNFSNPKSPEAREILQLYLDEDYGEDWPKWQAKIQEWLANNPD